jgi:hypothetical protein
VDVEVAVMMVVVVLLAAGGRDAVTVILVMDAAYVRVGVEEMVDVRSADGKDDVDSVVDGELLDVDIDVDIDVDPDRPIV